MHRCIEEVDTASNTLTAVVMPDGHDAARVIDIAFKRYDVSLGTVVR